MDDGNNGRIHVSNHLHDLMKGVSAGHNKGFKDIDGLVGLGMLKQLKRESVI